MMAVDDALGQFLWCFHPPIPRISTLHVVGGRFDCRCVPISGRYGTYGTVTLLNNNSKYSVVSLGSGTPIIIMVTIASLSLSVCPSLTVPHAHTHSLFSLV